MTEWVLIVGKVVKLAGVPMAGTQQRYQWFFDHDVYTYNLLESMNVIGVTARFYPSDPHYTDFIGGEPYLTLANKYLHEGRKATIEPALLKDRPYLGGVGAPDVTGGQEIVDSSKADLSAEAARYEIQETAHALGHIYQGDIVAPKGAIYVNYYTVDEIAEGSARLLWRTGPTPGCS